MNRKYCIVSDLDGTFFNSSSVPAPANLEALRDFAAEGNYFTVATGRYGKIAFKLAEYCNAPMIVCNGACLYDIESRSIFNVRTFDAAPAYRLMKEIHERYPKPRIRYTAPEGIHYLFEGEKTDLTGQWFKIVFESSGEDERDTKFRRYDLMQVEDYVKEHYPDSFRYQFSAPILFELLQDNASKGISVGDLREYYKERGEDVVLVGIGDYENDRELLCAADIAACPENALPEIKELVQSRGGIVTADNDTGAIASLIEHLKRV